MSELQRPQGDLRGDMKTKTGSLRWNIAAAAVGAVFFAFFFYFLRLGVGLADESFYLTLVKRLAQGDRLLADEWHVTQFMALFLYLPYRLYTSVAHGTDGIILFFRTLFACCSAAFYVYLYVKFRAYKGWAILIALFFCSYVPFSVFSLHYHNLAPYLLMAICFCYVFRTPETHIVFFVLAGVALSAAVLMEPPLAVLYFVFCIFVWIRALGLRSNRRLFEKFAFLLDLRSWGFLTLGVLASAAAFLVYLGVSVGAKNVFAAIPELFTDSEYDLSPGGNVWTFLFMKWGVLKRFFGWSIYLWPAAILPAAVIALRKRAAQWVRAAVFLAGCAALVCSCVLAAVIVRKYQQSSWMFFFSMSALPFSLFGLVCFLLNDKKDRRLLLFWLTGIAASFLMDTFSDVSVGVACMITFPADVLFFRELMSGLCTDRAAAEPRQEKEKHEKQGSRVFGRAAAGVGAAVMAFYVLWSFAVFGAAGVYHPVESEETGVLDTVFTQKIDAGPYRGIRTSAQTYLRYTAQLRDLDSIPAGEESFIYIFGQNEDLYLYSRCRCAAYSTWYVTADFANRQVRYWQLHPERRPAYLYFPAQGYFLSDIALRYRDWETVRQDLDVICSYEITRGADGYIIRVLEWKI